MPSTRELDASAAMGSLDPERIVELDVSDLFADDPDDQQSVIEQICQACADPGFFYVRNTCVSDEVIRQVLEHSACFFDQPDTAKQSVLNEQTDGHTGWGPMFTEPAYQHGTVAHLESFDLGQPLSPDRARTLGVQPNQWPDLPGFQEAVLAYYQAVTRLGRGLSRAFSVLLGESPEFINQRSGEAAPRTMRLLHYPGDSNPPGQQDVGISAHTDFECFTIMYQTAPGLELTDVRGDWWQAPHDVGTFTVILGDMLERLSNGALSATGHRVIHRPWTRYSMVLFFALDGDLTVEPLPRFVTDSRPAAYPPITQDQHIEAELDRARNDPH